MRAIVAVPLSCLAGPALAAEMSVTVEIPRLEVAEYHRPYVAVWLEKPDRRVAANLAVWYDVDLENGEGTKWLKDLRQWWRRTGRSLEMPVDGMSGATRPVGQNRLDLQDALELRELPAGEYSLVVEAAREVGGRELLRLPFQWPPSAARTLTVRGEQELGAIVLDIQP